MIHDGHFNFEQIEDLPFLLYVLFYDELKIFFGESEDITKNYKDIIDKIEKTNSVLIANLVNDLKFGILEPRYSRKSKETDLVKTKIDSVLFAAWVNKNKVIKSQIFINSVDILISKAKIQKIVNSFKKTNCPNRNLKNCPNKNLYGTYVEPFCISLVIKDLRMYMIIMNV